MKEEVTKKPSPSTKVETARGQSSAPTREASPKIAHREILRELGDWRRIVLVSVLALAAIYFLSGIYVVQSDEQGVVRRFGRVVSSNVPPGMHYRLPWPIDRVDRPKTTEVKIMSVGFRIVDQRYGIAPRPEETQMLTGDENIINIQMMVQYQISDPAAFLFALEGPQWLVRKACEAVLTRAIGSMGVDAVLTTEKVAIQERVRVEAQKIIDQYDCGVRIIGAYFQDIAPPQEVAFAFKDVASAREDRSRIINEAEGERNDVLPKARGEADQIVRQAEAGRRERIEMAHGDAHRFLALWEEYRKSPAVTARRLYVETMEEILPGLRKYVVAREGSTGVAGLRLLVPGVE